MLFKTVFGCGGIGPQRRMVVHAHEAPRRSLFGGQLPWSGAGVPDAAKMPVAGDGGSMGWQRAGRSKTAPLDRSCRQARDIQCRPVDVFRRIIEGLGLDVATADEAREILALKGGGQGRILKTERSTPPQRVIDTRRECQMLPPSAVMTKSTTSSGRDCAAALLHSKIAPDFQRWEEECRHHRAIRFALECRREAALACPQVPEQFGGAGGGDFRHNST